MISTISGEMKEGVHFTEVIENAFPMGSMTGAPKVSAMKLIERYERTPRGLYSGTVGYIVPLNYFPISSRLPKETKKKKQKGLKEKENDANFDFNVVIRSILYNSDTNYLSFSVGSAITVHSIPEEEYEECMIKAKGMFEALNPFYTHPKGEITEEKGKINLTESIHTKEGQKAKVSESTSSLHEYA
jgi:para-aminobenzoate synthetase component 1